MCKTKLKLIFILLYPALLRGRSLLVGANAVDGEEIGACWKCTGEDGKRGAELVLRVA
jgi:hypothetical protein